MPMPREEGIQKELMEGWRTYIRNLQKGLDILEEDIEEAAKMAGECTLEWCQAIEHVIDELGNSLYSISEPGWSSEEDSKKIRELRKRLHDLYAKYKSAAGS